MKTLYTELAHILNSAQELPVLTKHVTNTALLTAVLETSSTTAAASTLGIPYTALEHILHRKLKPSFPDKSKSQSWNIYLLGLFSLKKCSTCKNIFDFSAFSKDVGKSLGLCSECRICNADKSKRYRQEHPEACKETIKTHYNSNKQYYLYKNVLRKEKVKTATPKWADLSKLKEVYLNCPEGMHVDHVIPLQGHNVCGLHVHTNLQYLTPYDNLSKSNNFQ